MDEASEDFSKAKRKSSIKLLLSKIRHPLKSEKRKTLSFNQSNIDFDGDEQSDNVKSLRQQLKGRLTSSLTELRRPRLSLIERSQSSKSVSERPKMPTIENTEEVPRSSLTRRKSITVNPRSEACCKNSNQSLDCAKVANTS